MDRPHPLSFRGVLRVSPNETLGHEPCVPASDIGTQCPEPETAPLPVELHGPDSALSGEQELVAALVKGYGWHWVGAGVLRRPWRRDA